MRKVDRIKKNGEEGAGVDKEWNERTKGERWN